MRRTSRRPPPCATRRGDRWPAGTRGRRNTGRPSLADESGRLREELERLHAILRERGIEPGDEAAAAEPRPRPRGRPPGRAFDAVEGRFGVLAEVLHPGPFHAGVVPPDIDGDADVSSPIR